MKNIIISTVILFAAVIFTACNQSKPKEGQVIGVLYNSDGTRYDEGVSVFATAVTNEDTSPAKTEGDLQYKTNNKGEFILEKVKAGHYALCLCKITQPKFDRETGINNLPMPNVTIGQISNKGKPVYFTLPEKEGINLGNIEVTTLIH